MDNVALLGLAAACINGICLTIITIYTQHTTNVRAAAERKTSEKRLIDEREQAAQRLLEEKKHSFAVQEREQRFMRELERSRISTADAVECLELLFAIESTFVPGPDVEAFDIDDSLVLQLRLKAALLADSRARHVVGTLAAYLYPPPARMRHLSGFSKTGYSETQFRLVRWGELFLSAIVRGDETEPAGAAEYVLAVGRSIEQAAVRFYSERGESTQ